MTHNIQCYYVYIEELWVDTKVLPGWWPKSDRWVCGCGWIGGGGGTLDSHQGQSIGVNVLIAGKMKIAEKSGKYLPT